MKLMSKLLILLAPAPALLAPTQALASSPAQLLESGALNQFFIVGLFLFVFYFMIIRPQSKKAKEHKSLLNNLAVGDDVMTTGGMMGTIVNVTDEFFILAIAEGVNVPFQKQTIVNALPKGTLKSIKK